MTSNRIIKVQDVPITISNAELDDYKCSNLNTLKSKQVF